ncbi:hypothetical protein [Sphingomonas sp. ID0503]|uniref:hypothetical protein n=1 Tax=Sphingomonas sp. ID0503 TaxID=3399691 RepID=UPI003AFA7594
MIHATFTLANRAAIEAEIERLIGILDTADGDCDLEDDDFDRCTAGDDGCGAFQVPYGGLVFGASDDGTERLPLPIYGVDQTAGPTNVGKPIGLGTGRCSRDRVRSDSMAPRVQRQRWQGRDYEGWGGADIGADVPHPSRVAAARLRAAGGDHRRAGEGHRGEVPSEKPMTRRLLTSGQIMSIY